MVWDVKIKLKKIKEKEKKNWFTNPKTVHQYILVLKYSVPLVNLERYSKLCGEMLRCVLDVWDLLGNARDCCNFIIWLEKLVWEACLRCFECDVVVLKVWNSHIFEDFGSYLDQLKYLLLLSCFYWSLVWGLIHWSSISKIQDSLRFSIRNFCIYIYIYIYLCSSSWTYSIIQYQ